MCYAVGTPTEEAIAEMPTSDARKRANAKWDGANMRTVSCKIKREYADEFAAYCEQHSMSPSTAIRNYVLACIGRKDERMKEIYRSFDGNLSPENTDGYIIYEIAGGLLEIESLSVRPDTIDARFRIPRELLPESDYGDLAKIGELEADAWNGCYRRGQVFFKGKWYSGEMIDKIQQDAGDNYWQRHI